MSKTEDNKAVVGRWFTEFWGEKCNLSVVDAIAALCKTRPWLFGMSILFR